MGNGNVDFWQVGSIHGDEYYTRREDAEIIADNVIKLQIKVWLPFNDTNSVWAEVLRERGFETVVTEGDFFTVSSVLSATRRFLERKRLWTGFRVWG